MKGKLGLMCMLALGVSTPALADFKAADKHAADTTALQLRALQADFDKKFDDRAKSHAAVAAGQTADTESADKAIGDQVMNGFAQTDGLCQSVKVDDLTKTFSGRRKNAENYLSCVKLLTAAIKTNAARLNNPTTMLAVNSYADEVVKAAVDNTTPAVTEDQFMGLTWGVGFGFSFGGGARIDSADIDSAGIVRATSDKKQLPRAILEFHEYIFDGKYKENLLGTGPFVAVSSSDQKVLSGVAVGWMAGIKPDTKDSSGYSIGVGAILDAAVKDLATGFEDGKAAPAGETAARFKSESKWSAIVFVTRTF